MGRLIDSLFAGVKKDGLLVEAISVETKRYFSMGDELEDDQRQELQSRFEEHSEEQLIDVRALFRPYYQSQVFGLGLGFTVADLREVDYRSLRLSGRLVDLYFRVKGFIIEIVSDNKKFVDGNLMDLVSGRYPHLDSCGFVPEGCRELPGVFGELDEVTASFVGVDESCDARRKSLGQEGSQFGKEPLSFEKLFVDGTFGSTYAVAQCKVSQVFSRAWGFLLGPEAYKGVTAELDSDGRVRFFYDSGSVEIFPLRGFVLQNWDKQLYVPVSSVAAADGPQLAVPEGKCYLAFFSPRKWEFLGKVLGSRVTAGTLAYWIENVPHDWLCIDSCFTISSSVGVVHVERVPRDSSVVLQGGAFSMWNRPDLLSSLQSFGDRLVAGSRAQCRNQGAGYMGCASCDYCKYASGKHYEIVGHHLFPGDDVWKGQLKKLKTDVALMSSGVSRSMLDCDVIATAHMMGKNWLEGLEETVPGLFSQLTNETTGVARIPVVGRSELVVGADKYGGRALQVMLPQGNKYEVCGVVVNSQRPVILLAFNGLRVKVLGNVDGVVYTVKSLSYSAKVRYLHKRLKLDAADTFMRFWRKVATDFCVLRAPVRVTSDPCVVKVWDDLGEPLGDDEGGLSGQGIDVHEFDGKEGLLKVPVDRFGSALVLPARSLVEGKLVVNGTYLLAGDTRAVVVSSLVGHVFVETVCTGFRLYSGCDDYGLDDGGPSASDGEFVDEV